MQQNDLLYSKNALDVKAQFYNKRAIVYVEGVDEVPFWGEYFDSADYEVQEVGGCENLMQYIAKIRDGVTSFIVAMDNDYSDFIDDKFKSPLLIRTYGHSIENDMFCYANINVILRRLIKTQQDFSSDINSWLEAWNTSTYKLLLYDITSVVKKKGVEVCGNNCARFLKKTEPLVDDQVVDKFIESIKSNFLQEELDDIDAQIAEMKKGHHQLIKGHFIASGICHFIRYMLNKHTGRKNQLSNDAIFAMATACVKKCNPLCVAKLFLHDQIIAAQSNISA